MAGLCTSGDSCATVMTFIGGFACAGARTQVNAPPQPLRLRMPGDVPRYLMHISGSV
jgi:hypothetical protein